MEIIERLQTLAPSALEVIDDSASHAGHAGAMSHAEKSGFHEGTHFEIAITSGAFNGKPILQRHRMIYALLDDLIKTRIHALKIDARTM